MLPGSDGELAILPDRAAGPAADWRPSLETLAHGVAEPSPVSAPWRFRSDPSEARDDYDDELEDEDEDDDIDDDFDDEDDDDFDDDFDDEDDDDFEDEDEDLG